VNQSTQYSHLRVMSVLVGLALVGVAAYMNVNHAAQIETWSSPTVIAILALAFGSALAVSVMTAYWRTGRRELALLALAGLVASESYGFQLSAERLLAVRAQRAQHVLTEGSPYAQAKAALELAISERKEACTAERGTVRYCGSLRAREDGKRAALAAIPVPMSPTIVADTTGLPAWLVDIGSAMAFSTGLLVLGFVLVGFGAHGSPVEQIELIPAVPEEVLDERERVVSWIQEYRRRHGRNPQIPEVQQAFPGLPKTTTWRRLKSS
jgi:hypothetical protein